MEKEEIISQINNFLTEEFEVDPSKLTPEAVLRDTLQLDSLDYVDLVVEIEKNFGFKVKGEDFLAIITLQDFYDYVVNSLNNKKETV